MAIKYLDEPNSKPKSRIRYLDESDNGSIKNESKGFDILGNALNQTKKVFVGATFGTPGEVFIPGMQVEGSPTDVMRKQVSGLAENVTKDISNEPFELARKASGFLPEKRGGINIRELVSKISPKLASRFAIETALDPATLLAGPATKAAGGPAELAKGAGNMIKESAKGILDGVKRTVSAPLKMPQTISRIEKAVGQEITPQASKAIFRNTVGLPDDEVKRITGTYKGSVAPIVEKVKGGLRSKVDKADALFRKIVEDAPEDATLNVKDFKNYVGTVLRQNGIIDKSGKRIPGIGKDNRVLNSLYDVHQDLKKRVKLNKPERIKDIINRTPDLEKNAWTMTRENESLLNQAASFTDEIDKGQYFRLKQNLQSLLTGDNAIDRNIYSLIENLDDSISKSTIPGLNEAKEAYKSAREFESKFLNRNTGELKFGESKLEKLGTEGDLPEVEINSLKELERYIESPFIDETSKINKIRQFEDKYTPVKIEEDLNKFQKGEKYNFMQNLKQLMGPQADEIEKLLVKNKNQKRIKEFSEKGAIAGAGAVGIGALVKQLLKIRD